MVSLAFGPWSCCPRPWPSHWVLETYEKFQKNFDLHDWPIHKQAIEKQRIAAQTYFTGKAVSIIETKQVKSDKRTKLQAALAELGKGRGSEEQLDAVIKTAVEKNMRV